MEEIKRKYFTLKTKLIFLTNEVFVTYHIFQYGLLFSDAVYPSCLSINYNNCVLLKRIHLKCNY